MQTSARTDGRSGPLSPLPRPRVQYTFEGTVFTWFTVLFTLAALLLDENLILLVGCATLGCGQAARRIAARNLSGLEVERRAPARARVGTPVPVTYGVRNPRQRPAVGVEVQQRRGCFGIHPISLTVEFTGVEAGGRARHTQPLVFARRGHHRLGPLDVTSGYPLGFFRASARVVIGDTILVRPREGRPTEALMAWLGGAADARSKPSLVLRGDDILHGVREFREGDDPRRVHWRTTARRGTLTVMEWRREQGCELVILLGRGHGAGPEALRAFERTVGFVATLWRAAHRKGLDVRLDLGTRTAKAIRGRLGAGLDALADVKSQGGRRPRAALRKLAGRSGARAVVYVAAGPEKGIGSRLARAAGRGGSWLLLRADQPGAARWVRGL